MRIFKRLILISSLSVLLPLTGNSQMFERGKKNFFLEPEVSAVFSNYIKSAFTGRDFGTSFGMSGGKVFGSLFKVGLVYRFNQHKMESWANNPIYSNYQCQTIAIKTDLMIPLISSFLGKSKRYECKTLTNYLMMGPEIGINFSGSGENYSLNSPNFILNASYALLFKKSGSNKKQAANDIFLAFSLKKELTAFVNQHVNTQRFYSTYWGITIIWIHYKTGNWLGN